jgi:spoIIIJ-associated protein
MTNGHGPHRPARKPPQHRSKPSAPAARLDSDKAVRDLKAFLEQAIGATQFALEWDVATEAAQDDQGSNIVVSFRGEDEGLLLEHNAELLLAMEYIAHRCLRLDPRLHDAVRFDCGDYRTTRLDELKLSARVAAQRVRETGEAFRFNPMSSRDRRLIHLELAGAAGIRTMSEGNGDRRQLVIYPVANPKNNRG